VWKAVGVGAGIFLVSQNNHIRNLLIVCQWLLAFWFFAISLVGLIDGYKHAKFTLNWWALIFPNAGLTIALIQIGNVLDSDGIKGVCSAMTVILCIIWLWVAILHVRAVWNGQILWPHKDEDMEDVEGHQE
jgi:tellurite resistance protein TehA-like permease